MSFSTFPRHGAAHTANGKGGKKKQRSFFFSLAIGCAIALGAGLLLLVLFTTIALKTEDPDSITPTLAMTAFFLSAFLCGSISARLYGSSGALCGLCTSLLFLAVLILAVFAYGNSIRLPLFAIGAPLAILSAVISGIGAGRKRTEKKRKKHR